METIDTSQRHLLLISGLGYSYNMNYLLSIENRRDKHEYTIVLKFIDGKVLELTASISCFILIDHDSDSLRNLRIDETYTKYIPIMNSIMDDYIIELNKKWAAGAEINQIHDFVLYNGSKVTFYVNPIK